MHKFIRESAKVGVGLFLADIIAVLFFNSSGLFPLSLFGVVWTTSSIAPIVVFDIAVIIVLAHYSWRLRIPITSSSERFMLRLVGTAFLVVAIIHLLRLALNWNFVVGNVTIPLWLSWVGVAVAGYISYASFHLSFHKK